MILYGNSMSPFVRKVLAFAREKGLDLDVRAGGMGRGGPEFEETSPFLKMPGFRDPGADGGRDFCISDSTAIVTYLEAKHPEPPMIPADPIERARTIWFEEFADTILIKVGTAIFFNRFVCPKVLKRPGDLAVADAAVAGELPPVIDYLERSIPDTGFLVGGRLTLADLAVASPFVNLGHVGVDLDGTRWPRTVAYLDAILARPSFVPLVEAEKKLVAALG